MAILVHKRHGKILLTHGPVHSFQKDSSVGRRTISPVWASEGLCPLHATTTTLLQAASSHSKAAMLCQGKKGDAETRALPEGLT
jgi:hypothetical protein